MIRSQTSVHDAVINILQYSPVWNQVNGPHVRLPLWTNVWQYVEHHVTQRVFQPVSWIVAEQVEE